MKTKFTVDQTIATIGFAIAGGILSYIIFELGGIEFLLAGIILTMVIEGVMTVTLPCRWVGFIYHLLWAAAFYFTHPNHLMLDGWLWYLLWAVFVIRVVILQPVYLKEISRRAKKIKKYV